jgi:serine/threonine protein phosphatase PrpC
VSIELPRQAEWSVGARSETGYKRNENQDRMSRVSTALGDAYIVSDGMGGHKGGALAAQITVDTLQRTLGGAEPQENLAAAVRQAVVAANAEVHRRAYAGDPATHGMGATALVLLALRSSALVAHVGDSRAYLVRDGKLRLLTKDHTRVQRMVDAGMLTEEQAHDHPDAGVLERAIGHQRDVEVEISGPIELEYGDELLLCSDGLSSYVDQEQIERVFGESNTPAEQVDALIALALASGGHDNVTVQVIRYEGGMNERKRQILTYQLAFLPLVAVVAAATTYGVDYLNRPQLAAKAPADTATAATSVQSKAAAPTAAPAAPRASGDPELLKALGKLKDDVAQLSKRVEQLERRPAAAAPAANGPTTKRGAPAEATAHAKAAHDSRPVKRSGENKSKDAPASAAAPAPTPTPAAAETQNPPAASQSTAATAAQTPAPAPASANAGAQGAASAASDTKAAAKSDAAAKAGAVSAASEAGR